MILFNLLLFFFPNNKDLFSVFLFFISFGGRVVAYSFVFLVTDLIKSKAIHACHSYGCVCQLA